MKRTIQIFIPLLMAVIVGFAVAHLSSSLLDTVEVGYAFSAGFLYTIWNILAISMEKH
ncbi:MAG: hypothetical protein HFJ55_00350 [Clostridia bacterium]|nr:hypothetical protein [Clostridia bacterium]